MIEQGRMVNGLCECRSKNEEDHRKETAMTEHDSMVTGSSIDTGAARKRYGFRRFQVLAAEEDRNLPPAQCDAHSRISLLGAS